MPRHPQLLDLGPPTPQVTVLGVATLAAPSTRPLRASADPTAEASDDGEATLISMAKAALATGDIVETRRILDQHAHDFPNGRQAGAREALRMHLPP
jgi:hypothetical protein